MSEGEIIRGLVVLGGQLSYEVVVVPGVVFLELLNMYGNGHVHVTIVVLDVANAPKLRISRSDTLMLQPLADSSNNWLSYNY